MAVFLAIIRIFGNGIKQLTNGQRKPTFPEMQEQQQLVFQSVVKDI